MTVADAQPRLRALVADDDVETIESTVLLFGMQGYEAKTARDGAEAARVAKAFCPQLVLLGIAIPAGDGYDVACELRTIQRMAESTIVALTRYTFPLDRRRCVEAGFDLHLPKPVDSDVLRQLAELVHRRAPGRLDLIAALDELDWR